MLTTGIVLLTGIVTACYAPELVDRYWVSLLPICLFVSYINPRLRIPGLLAGSFLWATVFLYWQLDHRLTANQNNKRLEVLGEVINIPRTSSISTNFLFSPVSIKQYQGNLPEKIKVNWRNAPQNLRPGQLWSLLLKVKQPHGYQNPGGFDYERWMFVKGIHATAYVVKSELNRLQANNVSLNAFRFDLKQHIMASCNNCQHAGLIEALAIGYRGDLSILTRNLLNKTGTAHLIAVSGLHIGIVSAVFYSVGLMFWSAFFSRSHFKRKEFAMLISWLAGLGYSLLSGFDLPAQRAMLMLSVILFSLLLRTPFNLLNGIQSALILVLVTFPLAVLSESFWLTFTALMIIAFGSFLLQTQKSPIKKLVIIQLLFSILFIPVTIFIFGQIHSASMAANLIAVPLVSFVIVPLNFMLLLLFWLPESLLQTLYGLLDFLLDVLINYLHWLQHNGFQAINVVEIEPWKLAILLLFVTLSLLPRGFISRFILLFLLPVVVFWRQNPQAINQFTMTVLDVGMGTSLVVQTSHHSLIYDFGPGNKQGYSLGQWVVLPFMKKTGEFRPDRIVISHADQDHSGGYYALQDDYRGIPVYSGTPEAVEQKFPDLNYVKDCHQTANWSWDGVLFEFISSQPDVSASDNNRSCVLKVSTAQNSILIAGDIEAKQEQQLLNNQYSSLRSTVLVAPHHGSLTSSTVEFIGAVSADVVIFSSGFLNRWQFPRTEIVQRYLKTTSQLLQTDKTGAIRISCAEKDCELSTFRRQHPRIWY